MLFPEVALYDRSMVEDSVRDGRGSDTWLVVNQDGQTTLFQLVEVGEGGDVARLARELHAPVVVVDVRLPPLPAFDARPPVAGRSARSRLIQLNVRTATGDDATGVVARSTVGMA